ncbi:SOS response-associated peptidase [Thermodesulfobacteriota bacterium]
MCGRFVLMSVDKVVAEQFQISGEPPIKARYNIAPSQPIAVVRVSADSAERELKMLRWGLIPSWAKEKKIGYRMINARSETAAEKPAFRAAFKKRRCLIPADGFYEWKREKGKKQKQPYFIRMKAGKPFAMAGLWERWKDPEGEVIESTTIMTTSPNELLSRLHDRMPVILPPEAYETWLDPSMQTADRLKPLLRPYASDEMEAYEVSTRVNRPANDDPECVEAM